MLEIVLRGQSDGGYCGGARVSRVWGRRRFRSPDVYSAFWSFRVVIECYR